MATKLIRAAQGERKLICGLSAPVKIEAAEGERKGPPTFTSEFYTGGPMEIEGWDHRVAIDLAGLTQGKTLVANLDHDRTKRVGNFSVRNDGRTLIADGKASAATPYRDEVINSAVDGYEWQASLEVQPSGDGLEFIKAGKAVEVNGQAMAGPLYVVRKGTLKGFAFVSHGADDNTSASIAAKAASLQEPRKMRPEVEAWIKAMLPSLDIDSLTDQQIANFEADYDGQHGRRKVDGATRSVNGNPFEVRKIEAKRQAEIRDIAESFIERRKWDYEWIESIEKMCDHAIEAGTSPQEFKTNVYDATWPDAATIKNPRPRSDPKLSGKVLQAAVCQAGMLRDMDGFSDEEQQIARDRFKGGIGLVEFYNELAKINGYGGRLGTRINEEVHNYAMGFRDGGMRVHASSGFSTHDVSNILAATANKFLHEGWMSVDQTPLRIAAIRSVRNFQQITTVSLTGHLQFEKVAKDGEIKHGALGDLTYTNQIDTYAQMISITRQDFINDDLGALTAAPRRLGRGGMLALNDIFWTEFLVLVSANFFASGNANINTGAADMTIAGLAATETIFMNQTDPDGKPLGIMPRIVLVPTALKAAATALLDAQGGSRVLITGATSATIPDANVFFGRFRVESSPYISNASYTGNTAQAWWMLADPSDAAVIEIAALNGRVEPVVETAESSFNVLGTQMRGYTDVGVRRQEYRAGVHADGNSS